MTEISENKKSWDDLAQDNWRMKRKSYRGVKYLQWLYVLMKETLKRIDDQRRRISCGENWRNLPYEDARLLDREVIHININEKLLEKGIKEFMELEIPWVCVDTTGDNSHYYPRTLFRLSLWVVGSIMFSNYNNLGVDLIRLQLDRYLPILSKAGDKKANPKKVRTKLPKELVGQQIEWEKQDEETWIVHIIPRKTKTKYHKIYEKWQYLLEPYIDWPEDDD